MKGMHIDERKDPFVDVHLVLLPTIICRNQQGKVLLPKDLCYNDSNLGTKQSFRIGSQLKPFRSYLAFCDAGKGDLDE